MSSTLGVSPPDDDQQQLDQNARRYGRLRRLFRGSSVVKKVNIFIIKTPQILVGGFTSYDAVSWNCEVRFYYGGLVIMNKEKEVVLCG